MALFQFSCTRHIFLMVNPKYMKQRNMIIFFFDCISTMYLLFVFVPSANYVYGICYKYDMTVFSCPSFSMIFLYLDSMKFLKFLFVFLECQLFHWD